MEPNSSDAAKKLVVFHPLDEQRSTYSFRAATNVRTP